MELSWSQEFELGWHLFCSVQLHHKVAVLRATKHYLMWVLLRIEPVKGLRRVDMIFHIRELVLSVGLIFFLQGLCVYIPKHSFHI